MGVAICPLFGTATRSVACPRKGPLLLGLEGVLPAPLPRVDSSSPPELIVKLALAAAPAAAASLSAAATTAVGALSGARRAALRETLDGGARAALDRYLSSGAAIETRW